MFLKKRYIKMYAANVFLWIALFLALAPFILLVQTSFKPPEEILKIPPSLVYQPTLANYRMVLNAGLLRAFSNSMIIAGSATLIAILVGIPAAYSLSRVKPRGHNFFGLMILGMRFIPFIAVTLPMYILLSRAGLVGTRIGIILTYQVICLPIVIWLTKVFFDQLPYEVEEAAVIDGCTRFQAFLYVSLPMISVGAISAFLLVLIAAWNELFMAMILGRGPIQTLTVAMQQFLEGEFEAAAYGSISAWGTATTVPIVVVALIFNKYVLRGFGSYGE